MRVVLSCWGSLGDLFPYLEIARGLKRRGDEPVVATCPYYRPMVEAAGIEFHPVPPDVDPTDSVLLHRVMDPARGSEVIIRELIVPHVDAAVQTLLPVVEKADVVVTHPVTFAGPIAAERVGVPWLSTVLAPLSFFSLHDFPLLPPFPSLLRAARTSVPLASFSLRLCHTVTRRWTQPIRDLRRRMQLPDRGDPMYEGQFSLHGTLALFSKAMAAPQADWPPQTCVTGFVFHDTSGEMPPDLAAFLDRGEPPAVFTLGSSAVGAPGRFYVESLEAIERLGCRGVLLVGPFAKGAPPARSDRVAVAAYVPHRLLFPRAAAVVHHGGIGTLAQTMRAGVPSLVVPHAHDQPDNAFRATSLGIARTLDVRRYNGRRAAGHLRALLGQSSYPARAADVRSIIASERGVEAACERILAVGSQR